MSNLKQYDQINGIVLDQKGKFEELAKIHNAVNFKAESSFAMQVLSKNSFLCKVAMNNPKSLAMAVVNVAAIGLSLNPAHRYTYLVPRDGEVCLDISYMGYIKLACNSGNIKWAQAELVYEKDDFTFNGIGRRPEHNFNPFVDRGNIVGVYCVAKTSENDYLTTIMSIDEVYHIRDRSISWKSHKSKGSQTPWATDPGEMIKKTVIKRAAKTWPKVDNNRLDKAIDLSNQSEGIDFEAEANPAKLTSQQLTYLNNLLSGITNGRERLLKHLSDRYERHIETLEDLQQEEATYAINFLYQHANKSKS